MYRPGDSYYGEFVTSNPTTKAAADADSLPSAMATKNGADDAAFALTCAKLATGRYKITGTVPVGYAAGDKVQISVSATVATVAGCAVVDRFEVALANSGYPVVSAAGKVTVGTNDDKTAYQLAADQAVNVTKVAGTAQTARDLGAQLDAAISSRAPADTALSTGVWTAVRASYLNAPITSRLASADFVAPDNAGISAIGGAVGALANTVGVAGAGLTALGDARLANLDAAITTRAPAATALSNSLWTDTQASYLDAAISSRLAATAYTAPDNATIAGIATVTGPLSGMLELDGAAYRYTANALELAPASGGGAADWTADERAQIRSALGVDGDKTTAAGGQLQALIASASDLSLVSPLADTGDLTLVRGDDYSHPIGRSIQFADSGTTWPDLTGGSVVLEIRKTSDRSAVLTIDGVVDAARQVHFDLEAVETALLVVSKRYYLYKVVAVTVDGLVVTLAHGSVVIQ